MEVNIIKRFSKICVIFCLCFQMIVSLNVVWAGKGDIMIRLFEASTGRCIDLKVNTSMSISSLDRVRNEDTENTEYIHAGMILSKNGSFKDLKSGDTVVAVDFDSRDYTAKWLNLSKCDDFNSRVARFCRIWERPAQPSIVNRLVQLLFRKTSLHLKQSNLNPPTVIPQKTTEISSEPLPVLW